MEVAVSSVMPMEPPRGPPGHPRKEENAFHFAVVGDRPPHELQPVLLSEIVHQGKGSGIELSLIAEDSHAARHDGEEAETPFSKWA